MCLYSLYAYKKGYNRVDADIKQDTLEDCINSENILSKAIGNVHRDILYCSALQGKILAVLKEITTLETYKLILRDSIVMSRTHANFLLKFLWAGRRISSTYELCLNTNICVKTVGSVCENNVVSWKKRSWKLMKNVYLLLLFNVKVSLVRQRGQVNLTC